MLLGRADGAGEYYLGRLDGPPDARLRDIAERFGRIMPAILTDNIMGYLWAKERYGCLLIGAALVVERVAERFRARVKQHTGIWRDLRVRRRKSEVEFLTGELIRRAAARAVSLPVNARMARMIAEIEQRQRQQAWENLAELRLPSAPA